MSALILSFKLDLSSGYTQKLLLISHKPALWYILQMVYKYQ